MKASGSSGAFPFQHYLVISECGSHHCIFYV